MSYETEWNDEPPVKPFFSNAQISEQQKPFTACLKDSSGQIYEITMSLCLWDWFLVRTHTTSSLTGALDHILMWRKRRKSEQDISSLFALYTAEIIRLTDPNGTNNYSSFNHDRIMEYLQAESHKYYNELEDLQWRIDGKKTYPIMPPPFPSNPDILYK